MLRPIDADELKNLFGKPPDVDDFYMDDFMAGELAENDRLKGLVDAAKTIDVEPVRHGRWIKKSYLFGSYEFECSQCHEIECKPSANRMKYCMFCGAKMDGKQDA